MTLDSTLSDWLAALATVFTPRPKYYITFGEFFKRGEVLDIYQIMDKAEIRFPAGVTSMTAFPLEEVRPAPSGVRRTETILPARSGALAGHATAFIAWPVS